MRFMGVKDMIRKEGGKEASLNSNPSSQGGPRDGNGRGGEYTICVIMDGGRLLLKHANRDICKGKWNFAGGKIEKGETKEGCVAREIMEETGLTLNNLFYHGKIDCHYSDGNTRRVHIFSSNSFSGAVTGSEEGEVRWFDRDHLPRESMFADVELWLERVCEGKRFEVAVSYGGDGGEAIVGWSMEVKGGMLSRSI